MYTYNKTHPLKFSSTALDRGYNPRIIMYYNASDDLIKVEEIFGDKKYTMTISGTTTGGAPISQTVDHIVYYSAWEETTVS